MYTDHTLIIAGSSYAAETWSAQLKDTANANVGSAVTAGFLNDGGGNYYWSYSSFPDDFRGKVIFTSSPGGVVKRDVFAPPADGGVDAATVEELIAAMAGVVNPTIYAAGTGSTLDLYRGDSYANGDSRAIVITETANESHWPTTLSNVYFWGKPTAALVSVDPDASGVPPITSVSTLTSSSTTATCTTSTAHGLTTGDVVVIYGAAQPEYNKYASVTVTNATVFTYTITSGATTPATGTIRVQQGIACTVTSATGAAQAFRFEPTSAQLRRASAEGRGNGYTFWFIANPATAAAILRSGEWNVRPDPGM